MERGQNGQERAPGIEIARPCAFRPYRQRRGSYLSTPGLRIKQDFRLARTCAQFSRIQSQADGLPSNSILAEQRFAKKTPLRRTFGLL